MPGLILLIQQVAGLVQLGLTSYQNVKAAVAEGKARVTEASGREISYDELDQRFDEVLAQAASVGDAAAASIERDAQD